MQTAGLLVLAAGCTEVGVAKDRGWRTVVAAESWPEWRKQTGCVLEVNSAAGRRWRLLPFVAFENKPGQSSNYRCSIDGSNTNLGNLAINKCELLKTY